MKNFGYVLLVLAMIAGSTWATDRITPVENIDLVSLPDAATTEVQPEASSDETIVDKAEITDDGQVVPLGACCWAECSAEKAACRNACGTDTACRYNCTLQFIACLDGCT